MKLYTVSHLYHYFASLKRQVGLNGWLATGLSGLVFDSVLSPDNTGNFALGIANKSGLRLNNLEEIFILAFRINLDAALIRWLKKVLVALAPERKGKFRIGDKRVHPNIVIEHFGIDFYFDVFGRLRLGGFKTNE